MKSNRVIEFILFSSVSIIIGFLLMLINNDASKNFLPLFPVIYGILYLGIAKMHRAILNPAMFLFIVITAIRYFILPILLITDKNYSFSNINYFSGIQLMIYEEIYLGILFVYLMRTKYINLKQTNKMMFEYNKNTILYFICILSLAVIIVNPTSLDQFNFFFVSIDNAELIKSSQVTEGLETILINWGKIILPFLLSIKLINLHYDTKLNRYYYLTIFILIFFNLMIFSGTSRNSAIMPGIASMFYLINVFPHKKKQLFFLFSGSIFIVLIQLTILKLFYTSGSTISGLSEAVNYLESYFFSPNNYGIGISTKKIFDNNITINTFLNDVFGNAPWFSQFFDSNDRTTTYYNIIYHNGGLARDAIIPAINQGNIYFGWFFSVLPSVLIIYFGAYVDKIYRNTKRLDILYFSSYFAVRFGFTFIQNFSIILSFIYSLALPISILLFINKSIGNRREIRLE